MLSEEPIHWIMLNKIKTLPAAKLEAFIQCLALDPSQCIAWVAKCIESWCSEAVIYTKIGVFVVDSEEDSLAVIEACKEAFKVEIETFIATKA